MISIFSLSLIFVLNRKHELSQVDTIVAYPFTNNFYYLIFIHCTCVQGTG